MRHLLGTVINVLLSAEADAVCGAEWGQASPERTNQRTVTGIASSIPGPARSMSRSRNYGRAPTADWLLERRAGRIGADIWW